MRSLDHSPTVVITGVSTGIGKATAESFLRRGYRVVGSVRNASSVEDFKNKYKDQFIVWNCDLLQLENIHSILTILNENKISQVHVLVNNAGVALAAPFENQNFSDIEATMTVNVLAVMKVTQLLIPFLAAAKGRIINISSISGKSGTPFLGAYCASKHAVEGFSESLRREMKLYGVQVSIIGPGSIRTPIWSKGFVTFKNSKFSASFDRFLKFAENEEKNGLEVGSVVEDIMHAAEARFPRLRYAPIPRKIRNWYLPMLLPLSWVDHFICKALNLKRD